jgi:hypothetical protein
MAGTLPAMTLPPPRLTEASHVSPRRPDGSRGRLGPHVGPFTITPIRVVLAVAFVAALAVVGFAILKVRDSSQIPMVTVGVGVIGLVFAALSVGGAVRMWQAWRDEDQQQTLLFALGGGIAGMIALGCLAGALVLALVWRS